MVFDTVRHTDLITGFSLLSLTLSFAPQETVVLDKSLDLSGDQEMGAFSDHSHGTALMWLDVLVFCAILVALASCF
jgi:hypothetical protein